MSRWGNKFVDRRDWGRYNEELVVRGEFYLNLEFREEWFRELKKLNHPKKGGQFKFPESLMRLLMVWKQLVNYRGPEGIVRKMAQLGLIPVYPNYTTLWHRIHAEKPGLSPPAFSETEIGTDGTGLKTSNAGEYRVFKYGDRDARGRSISLSSSPLM